MAAEKLTALRVEKIKNPGYYGDGKGLWLRVKTTGAKSWMYRFMLQGKQREMGLGPYPEISLADARQLAADAREQTKRGTDPIEARHQAEADQQAQALLATARLMTFDQCTKAFISGKKAGWKNAKHAQQWENTLTTYASPLIGALPVESIDLALVRKVLDPIWREKTETASRVRSRIEAVLNWATVSKYRTGDNPARWRGNLEHLLPKPKDVSKPENQPALPYRQLGAFMAHLRQQTGIGAKPLELAILANARAGEVCGATWSEIDLDNRCWHIPAARMKADKDHHIPLSDAAVRLLLSIPRIEGIDYVFPGIKKGKTISDSTMNKLIRQMHDNEVKAGRAGYIDVKQGRVVVTHGFRSTFRDWAGETTAYAREVIEHAMAHQLKDKAEAAYARGSMFEKRRRLMADWSAFCDVEQRTAEVVPIRKTAQPT